MDEPRQPQPTSFCHVSFPSQPLDAGEVPLPVAEHRVGECCEELLVERPELAIGRLVGPAAEEDRHVHGPPVELALVDDPCTRLR